jgi:hypothetical protein
MGAPPWRGWGAKRAGAEPLVVPKSDVEVNFS